MGIPRFRIDAIELYERPVLLRIPFRFGAATVSEAPQAFVKAHIQLTDSREAEGGSAELMIPKWFDKTPQKTHAHNIADLRRSLFNAADAYTAEAQSRTAFDHFAAHYQPLIATGERIGLNALTANYGPALIDRAVLDALCRALNVSFYAAIAGNAVGIDARLTPDLAGVDLGHFLQTLAPATRIAARHTVGMLDPITAGDVSRRVGDGLPETLDDVIATYGNRYFKLKLGGDPDADVARLTAVASTLDRLPDYTITLDGNEQFADPSTISELWRKVNATAALKRLFAATLYLEQPLPRVQVWETDVSALAAIMPMLIDESDATLDAFPAAHALGYAGVSSKSCKGVYKSLLNAARCVQWNANAGGPRYFLSGEDLTAQAGLAVQQDLALVGLLGLAHVERNGHHYVDGFAGQGADEVEQRHFMAAQPGLYQRGQGGVRLAINNGDIDLSSLDAPGFASRAQPDWTALIPMVSGAASCSEPTTAI